MTHSVELFHLNVGEVGITTQALEAAILGSRVLIHDMILKDGVALVLLATKGTVCGFITAASTILAEQTVV